MKKYAFLEEYKVKKIAPGKEGHNRYAVIYTTNVGEFREELDVDENLSDDQLFNIYYEHRKAFEKTHWDREKHDEF